MTNFSPKDELESLYRQMYLLLQEEESLRSETEDLLKRAKKIVDPRQEFNKWLRSSKGQEWKRKQFEYQQKKCAFCKEILRYEDAVVHHVVPLSKMGSIA
ncbi:MAG: HNH endonuclease, partial [Halothece sp.]